VGGGDSTVGERKRSEPALGFQIYGNDPEDVFAGVLG
jgi:hypothetical protein